MVRRKPSRWSALALLTAAIVALGGGAIAGATDGKTATEQRYGGSDQTVDTAPEIRALVQDAIAADDIEAKLADLSRAEADRVIDEGMDASYAVNPSNGEVAPVLHDPDGTMQAAAARTKAPPRVIRRIAARAHPLARAATYRRYRSMYCVGYSSSGVKVYTYRQDWWWDYTGQSNPNGRVTAAGHHESASYTAPFWAYVSSAYLSPVGKVGTWYVGRQTQGTFRFSVQGVYHYRYQRMTGVVYGDGSSGWQCS